MKIDRLAKYLSTASTSLCKFAALLNPILQSIKGAITRTSWLESSYYVIVYGSLGRRIDSHDPQVTRVIPHPKYAYLQYLYALSMHAY